MLPAAVPANDWISSGAASSKAEPATVPIFVGAVSGLVGRAFRPLADLAAPAATLPTPVAPSNAPAPALIIIWSRFSPVHDCASSAFLAATSGGSPAFSNSLLTRSLISCLDPPAPISNPTNPAAAIPTPAAIDAGAATTAATAAAAGVTAEPKP